MNTIKIRKVKSTSEDYYAFVVIDTCSNIKERVKNDEQYMLGLQIRNDKGEIPFERLCLVDDIEICEDDTFEKLTPEEYQLLSLALIKRGYIFNKKTGEIIETNSFKRRMSNH